MTEEPDKTITIPLSEYVDIKAPKPPSTEDQAKDEKIAELLARLAAIDKEAADKEVAERKELFSKLTKDQQKKYEKSGIEVLRAVLDNSSSPSGLDMTPPPVHTLPTVVDLLAEKGFTGNYNIRTGAWDLP